MQKIAHFFSNIFQPLLMPTYCMLLLFQMDNTHQMIKLFSHSDKVYITLGIFVLTALIPVIAIIALKKFGVVSSILLSKRKERTIPYILTIITYTGAIFFLVSNNLPVYIIAMFIGSVSSVILIMIINFGWKISAHLSGMGGLTAGVLVVCNRMPVDAHWLVAVCFVLSLIVALSRIKLNVHTPMQTLAGFGMGFTLVTTAGLLF